VDITYEHPNATQYSGCGISTIGILPDGTRVAINTPYGQIWQIDVHHADPDARRQFSDAETAEIVAHAREHGKFGPLQAPRRAPRQPNQATIDYERRVGSRVCPRCGTFCEGDCQAH